MCYDRIYESLRLNGVDVQNKCTSNVWMEKSALPSGVKKETKMEMALEGFEPMISDSYAKQEVPQVLKML